MASPSRKAYREKYIGEAIGGLLGTIGTGITADANAKLQLQQMLADRAIKQREQQLKEAQVTADILTKGQGILQVGFDPTTGAPIQTEVPGVDVLPVLRKAGLAEAKSGFRQIYNMPQRDTVREDSLQLRQQKFERQKYEDERDLVANEARLLQAKPSFKKQEDALVAANTSREQLKLGSPVADQALKITLARAAGEVGVLTDRDVARFSGSTALASRIKQVANEIKTGKFTEANRELYAQLLDTWEKAANENINAMTTARIKAVKKYGVEIPEEDLQDILSGGRYRRSADLSTMSTEELLQSLIKGK